jgi:hypothetical protein
MSVSYDLDKIKFGVEEGTWTRAVGLYESGKVQRFQDAIYTFVAEVVGSDVYEVVVSKKDYASGNCTCYLGQNDTLCKHMIAVAIYGLKNGQSLSNEEKDQTTSITFCHKKGELSQEETVAFKADVTSALRYIKPYTGPSRTWFAYQDSLMEGANRLRALYSKLPASLQTAEVTVQTLLRLERKLMNGVDDSDGTVGDAMVELVDLLLTFADADKACINCFSKVEGLDTSFGWEERLVAYYKKGKAKMKKPV